jgi:hypothetical protein
VGIGNGGKRRNADLRREEQHPVRRRKARIGQCIQAIVNVDPQLVKKPTFLIEVIL